MNGRRPDCAACSTSLGRKPISTIVPILKWLAEKERRCATRPRAAAHENGLPVHWRASMRGASKRSTYIASWTTGVATGEDEWRSCREGPAGVLDIAAPRTNLLTNPPEGGGAGSAG